MDFNLPGIDTRDLSETGVSVPLKAVDGSPLLNALKQPVSLTLLGQDSKAYRDASRVLARKRVERAQAGGKGVPDDTQLDQADTDQLDMLVAVTVGWGGVLDSKDKPVPFGREAITAFYRMFPPAREQADMAVIDRTRFTKPSSEG